MDERFNAGFYVHGGVKDLFEISIFAGACKGIEHCGICLFICPKEVFEKSEETNRWGYVPPRVRDGGLCTGCRNCMVSCPDFAIVVEEGDTAAPAEGGAGNE